MFQRYSRIWVLIVVVLLVATTPLLRTSAQSTKKPLRVAAIAKTLDNISAEKAPSN